MADTLNCGRGFQPRRIGHVYCSVACRHRGERRPDQGNPVDTAAVERLFDETRDPSERVRPDDWNPGPPEFAELELCHTVATRRRWYLTLLEMGKL
jgi:hypothetical protein